MYRFMLTHEARLSEAQLTHWNIFIHLTCCNTHPSWGRWDMTKTYIKDPDSCKQAIN